MEFMNIFPEMLSVTYKQTKTGGYSRNSLDTVLIQSCADCFSVSSLNAQFGRTDNYISFLTENYLNISCTFDVKGHQTTFLEITEILPKER